MSENDQVYRIDLGDDALWNDTIERAEQTGTGVFVTQNRDVDPSELPDSYYPFSPPDIRYFASVSTIVSDVDINYFWPAAFPLLKRQAVVEIPPSIAKSVARPHSISSLLLQLAELEQRIEAIETELLAFDPIHGTLPLVASGDPVDEEVSDYLRRNQDSFSDIVYAGLLLANGEDEACHVVSQASSGDVDSDLDYWHGLVHRREPDYGNASYWFRRVGDHPAFDDLPDEIKYICTTVNGICVPASLLGMWSAFDAIDFFRRSVAQPGSELERVARLIQQAELSNLLAYVATM